MFSHNKRLQNTVRGNECNPGLANLMLEQFGGPQGELAAPRATSRSTWRRMIPVARTC